MSKIQRRRLPLCCVALLVATAAVRMAQTPKCSPIPNGTSWRIDQPTVNKPSTEYPSVRFKAGDKVTISAGGCVQTGGWGRTWKRYVNPSGRKSDRLYHGKINLPGIIPEGKVERISGYLDRQLTIPDQVNNAFLLLGYEDDNYDDNGYGGHDDGTEHQCKDEGPAWVVVQIIRGPGDWQQECTPMDLVSPDGLDYNGIPMNPRWGWEMTHNDHPDPGQLCGGLLAAAPLGNPPCTGQFTWLNIPSGFNSFICSFVGDSIHGHINWSPATVTGKLHWGERSIDDDYIWELWPAKNSGLTTANPNTIHLEFDSDETVDSISSGWWSQFHQAVDSSDDHAREMIGEIGDAYPDAIVIGLMGLDAEHSAHSELHPVFGMAIHLKDDPADDTWAIMARNGGNEGYCASDAKETLELDTLSFLIPRANVSGVTIREASFFSNTQATIMSVTPAPDGALVTFNLGPTSQQTLISGSLRLAWTVAAPPPSGTPRIGTATTAQQVSRFGHAGSVAQLQSQVKDETETHLETLTSPLSAEKRAELRKPSIAPRFPVTNPVQVVQRPLPAKRTQVPKIGRLADPRKQQRSLTRARQLCEAYAGKVPGLPPNACAQFKH